MYWISAADDRIGVLDPVELVLQSSCSETGHLAESYFLGVAARRTAAADIHIERILVDLALVRCIQLDRLGSHTKIPPDRRAAKLNAGPCKKRDQRRRIEKMLVGLMLGLDIEEWFVDLDRRIAGYIETSFC